MPSNLDKKLNDFVSVTAKSKVAVIVPLFGYWSDAPTEQLNEDTLKLSLDRLYSSVHQIYINLVGEAPRMTNAVSNIIVGKRQGGNAKGVLMTRGSTYTDYIREGIRVALEETDAQFIVNLNPWLISQHNGFDILIDRINRDDAKIVSGYDLRGVIDGGDFDTHSIQLPKEEHDLCLDFIGMKRYAAELIGFDERYKTHYFLSRDMWQTLYSKGFETITSQRIPIFTFEVDWTDLESVAEFEEDRAYFISKWKFDPGIKYDKKG